MKRDMGLVAIAALVGTLGCSDSGPTQPAMPEVPACEAMQTGWVEMLNNQARDTNLLIDGINKARLGANGGRARVQVNAGSHTIALVWAVNPLRGWPACQSATPSIRACETVSLVCNP